MSAVEWAPGWDWERLEAYAVDIRAASEVWSGRVVGFKGPSRHVGSTRLNTSMRQGHTISRSMTMRSSRDEVTERWVKVPTEPMACTALAVHLAVYPGNTWTQWLNGWETRTRSTHVYVATMVATGAHGDSPGTLKWYGRSYRVVARIENVEALRVQGMPGRLNALDLLRREGRSE